MTMCRKHPARMNGMAAIPAMPPITARVDLRGCAPEIGVGVVTGGSGRAADAGTQRIPSQRHNPSGDS